MPLSAPKWSTLDLQPRHPDVDAYIMRLELPVRRVMRELRGIVHAALADAREAIYFGVPFFFLDRPICYASAARGHVTFGFTEGATLADPSRMLAGTGKTSIRKMTLALDAPVPVDALFGLLQEAAGGVGHSALRRQ